MQTDDWPFRAAEALGAGNLTFRELRRFHRAVHPGVWVPRDVDLTIAQRAKAAWLWSGRRGVVAGLAASAMLGAKWVPDDVPVELVHGNRRPPSGIWVHTDSLADDEVHSIDELPVTTPARTAFDLGRRLKLTEGVQRIDALLSATNVQVDAVERVIACHPGVAGLRTLRQTLALVDRGAESPYESLTRLLLVQNHFPVPQTQVVVLDERGFFFARLDIGWPQYRVGVEFEGAHHWTDARQRSRDVERFARLPELGWTVIRLTSGMLHNRPQTFFDRVGDALLARDCPKTW